MLRFPSLNFGQIADYISGIVPNRPPLRKGFILPLKTLFAVLAMAGVYQGLILLAQWMGVTASAALLSVSSPLLAVTATFAVTFVGLSGLAFLNYWFRREILAISSKSREITRFREGNVNRDFIFDSENPIAPRQMIRHLVDEVNAYFEDKLGPAHKKLFMPRVHVFTEAHRKLHVFEGRNRQTGAIYISEGMLKAHETGMNQRELAAVLAVSIVKMYKNYGMTNMAITMAGHLMETFRSQWQASIVGLFFLGATVGWMAPLASLTLLLIPCAIKRAQTIEAAKVVVDLGRGVDLIDANDRRVVSSQEEKGTRLTMKAYKDYKKAKRQERAPLYNGFLANWIRPLQKWIDDNELAADNQRTLRWASLFDILVREIGLLFNEIFQEEPRNTNLNRYLRKITHNRVKEPRSRRMVDMSVEEAKSKKAISAIAHKEIQDKNLPLYRYQQEQRAAAGKPLRFYAPISPDGDGYADPLPERHGHRNGNGRGHRH